ncbi:MAG: type II toxin-antitoxin system VapC family toxin [Bacteroidetes bacterium]|nr:type II toxin-antitoxin system VapC family toxin [Bacteroidota bacterium]
MKQSVYLETTIISYLAARPSRDLIVAGHQQITLEWWEKVSPKFQCYVSEVVIEESEKGDIEVSKKRLDLISGFQVLAVNEEIKKIASIFFEQLRIREKSRLDSFHLATACWYKMDYLLSWNCKNCKRLS